jgi:glycosyltransferase involved in cell wall biosynthesis
MRILIIHNEARYFAGAEKVLGYYLEGWPARGEEVAAALVPDARVLEVIPPSVRRIWIPEKQQFSILKLCRQATALLRARRDYPFDLVHGWTARDWELTSLVGWLSRRPALGTLHDHPRSRFISPTRQRLMRGCGRLGLSRVICVSDAVRRACLAAGYDERNLMVIHNGLPYRVTTRLPRSEAPWRLGFLGAFSERKGLRTLFTIIDHLARQTDQPWELHLAGEAQDVDGRQLMDQLGRQFGAASWWAEVHWHGWVKEPHRFLTALDLLVVPSSEFDPLPTVLLEAAQTGVAVFAANVGGVGEIVLDGETGLLFDPGDPATAATRLARLLKEPETCRKMASGAALRARREFEVGKMVAEYLKLYSTLTPHV